MENSFQKEQTERMQEQLKAIHKAIMDRAGNMDAERVHLLTKAQLRIIRTMDFISE